jgi:hypothetical protein
MYGMEGEQFNWPTLKCIQNLAGYKVGCEMDF